MNKVKQQIANCNMQIDALYASASKLLEMGYDNSCEEVQKLLNKAEALIELVAELEDELCVK